MHCGDGELGCYTLTICATWLWWSCGWWVWSVCPPSPRPPCTSPGGRRGRRGRPPWKAEFYQGGNFTILLLPACHHCLVGDNISELRLLVLGPLHVARQDIVLLKLQVDCHAGGDEDQEEDEVVEEEEEEGLHHRHPPSPPPDWRPPSWARVRAADDRPPGFWLGLKPGRAEASTAGKAASQRPLTGCQRRQLPPIISSAGLLYPGISKGERWWMMRRGKVCWLAGTSLHSPSSVFPRPVGQLATVGNPLAIQVAASAAAPRAVKLLK